jgi:hypothetical protein
VTTPEATKAQTVQRFSGGGVVGGIVSGKPANAEQQMGMQRVTIGGEPAANVVINAGYGGTISGRIVFDGDAQPAAPQRITISAATRRTFPPRMNDSGDECRTFKTNAVNADMTFTLENVRGSCVLTVGVGDAGGWRARSAMYRGADLLDRPIELWGNQQVRDVQIVLTNKRTDLSADVTDDQGAPTQDYLLVAFSTEKERWPLQRYLTYTASSAPPQSSSAAPSSAPSATAGFGAVSAINAAIRGRSGGMSALPAGDYYVVAIDDATFEDIHDPVFLDQLVPSATRVTLREGEPQKVQLRRVKAPARQ